MTKPKTQNKRAARKNGSSVYIRRFHYEYKEALRMIPIHTEGQLFYGHCPMGGGFGFY